LLIFRFSEFWRNLQQVYVGMTRLSEILSTTTDKKETTFLDLDSINGDIIFENVSFKYPHTDAYALKNINLQIQSNEIVGIVGSSGSGKSTLSKLIQMLYSPSKGKISINDRDLSFINPESFRNHIGVVLQENILFQKSIKDNIALSNPNISFQKIMDAAKLSG